MRKVALKKETISLFIQHHDTQLHIQQFPTDVTHGTGIPMLPQLEKGPLTSTMSIDTISWFMNIKSEILCPKQGRSFLQQSECLHSIDVQRYNLRKTRLSSFRKSVVFHWYYRDNISDRCHDFPHFLH